MTLRNSLSLLIFSGFLALSMGSDPDEPGGTLPGSQVSAETDAYLAANNILEDGEKIIAYYDVTLSLDNETSCILTNQRVIYHDSPKTTGIKLADVKSVEVTDEGLIGTVITVHGSDSADTLRLEIAPLNGGDFFAEELKTAVKDAGGTLN